VWTCSRCKQKFVRRNQSHSCGPYSVAGFLKGKSAKGVRLFRLFLRAYTKIGPFELHPVKTRVALLRQIRFAAINKVGTDYLDGHFVLTFRLPDGSLIYKIDNLNGRYFVHHFRVRQPKDIQGELRKHMKLAYDVGTRKHIRKEPGIRASIALERTQ